MKRNIEVTYDGEWPNACGGRLTIKLDGNTIYTDDYCCHSTGSCYVDFHDDGCDSTEVVESGELVWDEAEKYDKDIQDAVSSVLSEVGVCCGGCI
jgi:hypothetical protein